MTAPSTANGHLKPQLPRHLRLGIYVKQHRPSTNAVSMQKYVYLSLMCIRNYSLVTNVVSRKGQNGD